MPSLPRNLCSVMVGFYLYSICPNSHVPAEKLGDSGLSVHPTYPPELCFGFELMPTPTQEEVPGSNPRSRSTPSMMPVQYRLYCLA